MKKKILVSATACFMAMSVNAQVLFPTPDLYDTDMMSMYINAARETARARLDNFMYYYDKAVNAYNGQQWNNVIYYAKKAFETDYEDGQLYFMRGVAYERQGYVKEAKKDYKTALKQGYREAQKALEYLEAKRK